MVPFTLRHNFYNFYFSVKQDKSLGYSEKLNFNYMFPPTNYLPSPLHILEITNLATKLNGAIVQIIFPIVTKPALFQLSHVASSLFDIHTTQCSVEIVTLLKQM